MNPTPTRLEPARGQRRCIVSGESFPERALVRFALAPDGTVAPDVAAKLPGRGAWVRAERACVEAAQRKNAFSRAFKAKAEPGADLAERTEALLARRCLDQLGLARRAGVVAIGAAQVEQSLRSRPLALLFEAADGAEEGRETVMRRHIGFWGAPPPVAGCFTGEELGVALGRERVIHASVLQERLAAACAAELGRLAGFRAIVPSSWPVSWRSLG